MKLIFEGETLNDLHSQVIKVAAELLSENHTVVAPETTTPETTGIVEHDLTKVQPAKRGRKPKVAQEVKPEEVKPEEPINETLTAPVAIVDDPAFNHFKNNFSQTIFVLLQQNKINQEYIKNKVAEYGLKNILEVKSDDNLICKFYNELLNEGRL